MVGSSKKYKEITDFGELITALVNFSAANRELWPMDMTGDFMWHCLHSYR